MTDQDYKGNEELSEDEAEVLFKIRKKAKKAESKLRTQRESQKMIYYFFLQKIKSPIYRAFT